METDNFFPLVFGSGTYVGTTLSDRGVVSNFHTVATSDKTGQNVDWFVDLLFDGDMKAGRLPGDLHFSQEISWLVGKKFI